MQQKNYDISISNGLLTEQHRGLVGPAVWEFIWLLDKVTKIDDAKMGLVLGGKPINLFDIAEQMGVTEKTVSRSLHRLEKHKYIIITRTPYGLSIKVCRAKKTFSSDRTKMSDHSERDRTKMSDGADKNVRSNKIIAADNCSNPRGLGGAARNREVDELISHLKERVGSQRLDDTERDNRRYAYLCLSKFARGGNGLENAKKVIDLAVKDPFHAKNCTKMRYLYYNGLAIVASARLKVNQKKGII